jgi:ribosomal-protein-alanine N-acetyltransferase
VLDLDFKPFPELATPRLRLRAIEPGDAGALFALRSDPRVMRYIGRPLARTLEDAEKLVRVMQENFEAKTGIAWAVTVHGRNELVGTVGFWRIDAENHHGDLGYLLSPDLWGRGLMREAAGTVVACGFERLRFHRIEACVDPANAASIRVLESLGFSREAYHRENFCFEGRFLDTLVYARLNRAR